MPRTRAAARPSAEFLVRLVSLAAVWIGLHLYAGRPLVAAARAGGIAPAVAYAGLVLISIISILPMLARRNDALRVRSAAHWIGYATMSLFATLLVLVFLSDVARGVYALLRTFASSHPWPLVDVTRLSLVIAASAAALSAVGLVQARRPRIRNVSIPIDSLPESLDGYRIVQWSDVHVGPTIQRGFVASLVERTNALRADAVVITGDLVDGELAQLRDEVRPLADLRARDGVFFVTGNHEYYWRAPEWIRHLESLGLTFLGNAHRVVRRDDAQLVIAGVTDPAGARAHKPDANAAFANAPRNATRVLLAHRPQASEDAVRHEVALQLSGHTHGGQFFPFNLVIRWFQPVVAGLHRIGRTWLYVSRGTGYWGPPSRLGVGGEITVLELHRG